MSDDGTLLPTGIAESFLNAMARGEFDKAVADFEDALKEYVLPADLMRYWNKFKRTTASGCPTRLRGRKYPAVCKSYTFPCSVNARKSSSRWS